MKVSKWMLRTKRADFDAIAKKYGISPITARLIRNRDIVEEEDINRYLNGTLTDLYSPWLLKDMKRAVEILREKAEQGVRIRIVGDYDIDGICSTYLLYRALERIGAVVDYAVPDRIRDGYGINEAIIRRAWKAGVDTILTCDNGIAAIEEIRTAKELGLTVIVTDHHELVTEGSDNVKQILPPADAVINPKQKDCLYPNSEICGGVVAFKLVEALYEMCRIPRSEWEDMLEYAAIATVGDVMNLQDENRIIVKEGLKRLRNTKNLGIRKLIEKNNLNAAQLNTYHIGFVLGPCFNASGRLETAERALELLLCQEETKADELASHLKELNDIRKAMTAKGVEEAIAQVEQEEQKPQVLVVFLPDCHESLAGIIAGRLREHYYRPSLVLTRGEEPGMVKGSGRSIDSYHMFEALVAVKELLTRFGGHRMAAGLSMEERQIGALRLALCEQANLTEEELLPKIWIDAPVPVDYVTERLISELELLEPYGQGNEKPQFAQKNLQIRSTKVFGKNRNVVKLSLIAEGGMPAEGTLFTDGDLFLQELGHSRSMDIIYFPTINEYNGNRALQMVIKHYQLHNES